MVTAKRKSQQRRGWGGNTTGDQVAQESPHWEDDTERGGGEEEGQIGSLSTAGDGPELLSYSARYGDAVPGMLVAPGLWSPPV